jgi:hypothetical protein
MNGGAAAGRTSAFKASRLDDHRDAQGASVAFPLTS